MAPSLFSGSNVGTVSLFEIRLDQNNIFLRGGEDEASSAILKGSLVLCLSDSLRLQCVRMRFTGERRLSWAEPGSSQGSYVKSQEEFFRRTWDFLIPSKRSGETLQKGNYEWPFEHVLPGNWSESVEGLPDSWVIYRMKATIERGILQQNSIARKHVRIIRTLDPSALELTHAMSVENVWAGKLNYSLSTPTKGVIFGTAIRVDFKLVPLLKGLKIGEICTELIETQEFRLDNIKHPRCRTTLRTVAREKWHLPDDAQTEEVDGQDAYILHKLLPIPKSLRHCLQTVDTQGFKIRHILSFNIQLHNPDAHISELHATLPLLVFISPNLPLDDNNNMVYQDLQIQASDALNHLAPPLYGEHLFDQLYSEVDASGYMTPAGELSGINTPFTSQSRTASTENLTSMDAVTNSGFAATVLHNRLHNLENSASSRWARDRPYRLGSVDDNAESYARENSGERELSPSVLSSPHAVGYPSNSRGSPARPSPSNPVSRRASEEDTVRTGTHTPQHIEFSAEDLAKVPSYTTALQSRFIAPINDGLPNYQTAIRIPETSPSTHSGQTHGRGLSGDPSAPVRTVDEINDAERRHRILMVQNNS